MKKLLIICTLWCISTFSIYAQQIMIGPVSGVNFSRYSIGYADADFDAYFSRSFKTGIHVGVTMDYQFGGRFGIQPSVMFTQRGTSLSFVKTNTNPTSYESSHTINYIDVPILFKYKLGTPERGLAVMAGPSLNFGIGGSYTETGSLNINGTIYKVSETDKSISMGSKVNSQYKNFEFSFVFGVGTYFSVGDAGKLIIEARYNIGGGNILNSKYQDQTVLGTNNKITGYNIINDTEIISSVRNRSIQLSLGYLFEL